MAISRLVALSFIQAVPKLIIDMQESDEGVIEHNVFDCLSLERMLQFIYEGDYTVKAVIPVEMDIDKSRYLPPHLRKPAIPEGIKTRQPESLFTATSPMTAHAYVYAIAEYYDLPELKSLALQKFKDIEKISSVEDFLHLTTHIYGDAKTDDDQLRKELLSMLLDD